MDDLVNELRDWKRAMYNTGWLHLAKSMDATADRIEALTAENERLDKACCEWADVSQANYQRAKAAEARLAKAVEALERIKSGEFSNIALPTLPPKDAAAHFAEAILAELKGDTNE